MSNEISYADLAFMTGKDCPTISYCYFENCRHQHGSLVRGQSVKTVDGMEFDVDETNNA